jgi:hypothetical protein
VVIGEESGPSFLLLFFSASNTERAKPARVSSHLPGTLFYIHTLQAADAADFYFKGASALEYFYSGENKKRLS